MRKGVLNKNNINKTINYLRKNGIKRTYYAARERIEEEKKSDYIYMKPSAGELAAQRKMSGSFPYKFSIVVPAYETKEAYFKELIESVCAQSYENWELIIIDAGQETKLMEAAAQYSERLGEGKLLYLRLGENRGISENSNAGIEMAVGDYIALADHDDVLAPDALYKIADAIKTREKMGKKPALLYSDEDKLDGNGSFSEPHIKGKFNLDLLLSNNYICHLMAAESSWLKKLKLRKDYDGAQDYDFVLRLVSELMNEMPAKELGESIIHVAGVLYHWRCHGASTAQNTASKAYAYEAGKRALEDFCIKRGWQVRVSHAPHLGFYKIKYEPDIFTVRRDIGVIGGKVLDRRGRITSGIYESGGTRLYTGLRREYSGGSTHKASLAQDCAAVDIRCMRLRSELWPVFKQITGVMYMENNKTGLAEISALNCDEEGYKKLSMEIGRAAAARGWLVVWIPEMEIIK